MKIKLEKNKIPRTASHFKKRKVLAGKAKNSADTMEQKIKQIFKVPGEVSKKKIAKRKIITKDILPVIDVESPEFAKMVEIFPASRLKDAVIQGSKILLKPIKVPTFAKAGALLLLLSFGVYGATLSKNYLEQGLLKQLASKQQAAKPVAQNKINPKIKDGAIAKLSRAVPRVLGESTTSQSNSNLPAQIRNILDQYIKEGKITGQKGEPGEPGRAGGSVVGSAPIIYYPPNPSQNFTGGTYLGVTNLSSQNHTVTNNLTVSGNTTIAGALNVSNFSINGITVAGSAQWAADGNNISYSRGNVSVGTASSSGQLTVLDSAAGSYYGSELVNNGNFSGSTEGWTLGDSWGYSTNGVGFVAPVFSGAVTRFSATESAGSGYSVGDVLTLLPGTSDPAGTGGTITVTAVATNGQIESMRGMEAIGRDYNVNQIVDVVGGSGSGAQLLITNMDGEGGVEDFVIQNPGSGYSSGCDTYEVEGTSGHDFRPILCAGSSGGVVSFTLRSGGSGYLEEEHNTSGGHGSGFVANIREVSALGTIDLIPGFDDGHYGTGYHVGDVLTVLPGIGDNEASGGTLTVTEVSNGEIFASSIQNDGIGYQVGDVLTIPGGTGGEYTVSGIDEAGDGHIESIAGINGADQMGSGYERGDILNVAAGTGGQITIDAVLDGQVFFAFPETVANAGSGYAADDIITVNGGDGPVDLIIVEVANDSLGLWEPNTADGNNGVTASGTGYSVGDIVNVDGGSGGQLYVQVVDENGGVQSYSVYENGSGYTLGYNAYATSYGGSGTGFVANVGVLPEGGVLFAESNSSHNGTGYTSGNYSVTGGSGSGFSPMVLAGDISFGFFTEANIHNPGSGYVPGDIITISGGSGAKIIIAGTNSSGGVTDWNLYKPGTGYTAGYATHSTTGGSGTGFSMDLGFPDFGGIVDSELTEAGSGYAYGVHLALGGHGSGYMPLLNTESELGELQYNDYQPVNGGSGYQVGDLVDVSGGTGGKVFVTSVSPSGAVRTIYIARNGTGYASDWAYRSTTGGSGTGLLINAFARNYHNNAITAGSITSAGSGYTSGTNLTLSGGSGSGATINITATGLGGAISEVDVTTGGSNYIAGNHAVSGGHGAGAVPFLAVESAAGGNLVQDLSIESGRRYRVKFTLSGEEEGCVSVFLGGALVSGDSFCGDTIAEVIVEAVNSNGLIFSPSSDFIGNISHVSVTQLKPGATAVSIVNSNSGKVLGISTGISGDNIFFGQESGGFNTDGLGNATLGYQTLYNNAEGSNNLALGYQAGFSNANGSNNIFIGNQAGYSETGSNKLYISNSSSSPLIYGDLTAGLLGINTINPNATLDVLGNPAQTGTGTISDDGDGNITGTGTAFTTELHRGDIVRDSNGEEAIVIYIESDTVMQVSKNLNGDTDQTFTYKHPVLNVTNYGADFPALSVSARGGLSSLNSYSYAGGVSSIAWGDDNLASGDYAAAFGSTNAAGGNFSFTAGLGNIVEGDASAAFGWGNSVFGPNSLALGKFNSVHGNTSMVFGENMQVDGSNSVGINLNYYEYPNLTRDNTMAIMGGNVGIGTTTPDVALSVQGDINLTGNIYKNGSLFGGGDSAWSTTLGSDLYFDAGNVGIGTSNPAANLHVYGEGSGEFTGGYESVLAIESADANPWALSIRRQDIGASSDISLYNNGDETTGDWRFAVGDGADSYYTPVDINKYGLTIGEQGLVGGNALAISPDVGGGMLYGTISAPVPFAWSLGYTSDVTVTSTPVITWNGLGKVGIGTTTPAALFDIRGSDGSIGSGLIADDGDGNITGTDTAFLAELQVGDSIEFYGANAPGIITEIIDDTHMIVSHVHTDPFIDSGFNYQSPLLSVSNAYEGLLNVYGLTNSASLGVGSLVSGGYSYALGAYNTVTSPYTEGPGGVAIGGGNTISSVLASAIGVNNTVTGDSSNAYGLYNTVSGQDAFAIGRYLNATSTGGFVLGSGYSYDHLLTNTIDSSLMIGFNSDIATLFVGPGNGTSTVGNVGIGTTTPGSALTVAGDINFTGNLLYNGSPITFNISSGLTLTGSDFVDSVDINSEVIEPIHVSFSSDGTHMFVIDDDTGNIFQYDLGLAWDITTASYSSNSFDPGSEFAFGVWYASWKTDGTKLYVEGNADGDTKVVEYYLSSPWDISTASSTGNSIDISTDISNGGDWVWNSDGSEAFVTAWEGGLIHRYSLLTPWDLTTATYTGPVLEVSIGSGFPIGMSFFNSGLNMGVVMFNPGSGSIVLYSYTLDSAYDVSSASPDGSSFDLTVYGNITVPFFSPEGDQFYFPVEGYSAVNGGDGSIIQFELGASSSGLQWTTSGSDIYFSRGNVGIGTHEASALLDVQGSGMLPGTGTISDDGYGIITGIGTRFEEELSEGDTILIGSFPFGLPATIYEISDNEHMRVQHDLSETYVDTTFAYQKPLVVMGEPSGPETIFSASGYTASLSLGYQNTVSGYFGTAIGTGNTVMSAVGPDGLMGTAALALGSANTVRGQGSIAIGSYLTAGADGAIVIGSGDFEDEGSLTNNIENSLMVGFNSDVPTLFVGAGSGLGTFGKVGIGTTTPDFLITLSGGAYSDGSSWSNASDKNLKENFATVTPADILQKIVSLPISQWNYKTDTATTTHMGPTAQDFYAAFGLGGKGGAKSISTIDEPAIALLGIQALNQKIIDLQGALVNNASSTIALTVTQAVVYEKTLTVLGQVYFSGDNVGQAQILAGENSVRINFSQAYLYQPIITISPIDFDGKWKLKNVDSQGFTIKLTEKQNLDVTFNWHSFASEQAKLTVSSGTTSPITLVVVSGEVLGEAISTPNTGPVISNSPQQPAEAPSPTPEVLGEFTTSPEAVVDQPAFPSPDPTPVVDAPADVPDSPSPKAPDEAPTVTAPEPPPASAAPSEPTP